MKYSNLLFAGMLSCLSFSASAGYFYQVGSVTTGTTVAAYDIFGINVVKLQRPKGTNNIHITFADKTTTIVPDMWSGVVSGNAKVFHSYDGLQGAGTSVVSGMGDGFDAIAVVRANILYKTGNVPAKEATYFLPGNVTVTLKQSNYLDWIWG